MLRSAFLIKIFFCLMFYVSQVVVHAQDCPTRQNFRKRSGSVSEISMSVGATHYFGDLNTYNLSERRIVGKINAENMYPALSFNYRFYPNRFFDAKLGVLYTRLRGSDQHNETTDDFTYSWFRKYRNLTFRTDLLEISLSGEINIIGFEPGNMRKRFSPFVAAGLGMIVFDPKAPYSSSWIHDQMDNSKGIIQNPFNYQYDRWIRLQPLGTEGQGLPGYANKYKLVQPMYTLGLGIKCNITPKVNLSWQLNHHFTFTDYLDDVSTLYPDVNDFYRYYDYEKATLIAHLSVRSKEVDPTGQYEYITAARQQRGSPKYNDSYLSSVLTLGLKLNNRLQKNSTLPPKRIQKKADKENESTDIPSDQPEQSHQKIKLYKQRKKDTRLYKDIYFNRRSYSRDGITGLK